MTMQIEVLRLRPGEDLRGALEAAFRGIGERGIDAACVVSAVGSLSRAQLRYADAPRGTALDGPLELLSLSGTLSRDGPHLHASVADAAGRVSGGHVLRGCTVRTTAELVLALLPGWQFGRAPDAATGFLELVVRRPGPGP
jgi:predicted DNA-binding protein with PD1-like motif